MKMEDAFPSTAKFSKILCSNSNKMRLQKLVERHLIEKSNDVNPEIIYSVGTQCTNLTTQQQNQDLCCDQSEADSIVISIYAIQRNSGYTRPVLIDAADTDVYIAASFASHQFPGDLLMKKTEELLSAGR